MSRGLRRELRNTARRNRTGSPLRKLVEKIDKSAEGKESSSFGGGGGVTGGGVIRKTDEKAKQRKSGVKLNKREGESRRRQRPLSWGKSNLQVHTKKHNGTALRNRQNQAQGGQKTDRETKARSKEHQSFAGKKEGRLERRVSIESE